MKRRLGNSLILLVLLVSFGTPLNLVQADTSPNVFINEIHYDNVSDDAGEAIEIAGPAGTDLTDWSIALYNGSSSQLNVYDTISLAGVIPDQDNGYGTLEFPRAGIQNGAPDGLALVDDSNTVVQFLCYEGTFTAASGPAADMTCTDIGVEESSSTAVGDSLQLTGTGTTYDDFTWTGPIPNTFGAVNTGQTFGTPVPPPPDFVSIHDIQYTTDASGDSPYAGQTVTTEGVVTGFFYDGGNKYTFIQDGTGAWSGLVLYKPDAYINVGDKLQVHGQVSEYSGLTEIAYGAATVLSSGNSLPVPEILSSGEVSQEKWESVLVRVENVRVTNPNLGYGEWQVDDGSGGVVVDDLGFYGYSPVLDALLPFVQGPLFYSFGAFKIEPRNDSDIGAPIEILPIGTVNGVVGDTDDGTAHRSPYAPPSGNDSGQKVVVQGVIYAKTLQATSYGATYKGFYIQNTAATADGDPNTSDGLFVYMYTYPDLNGGYVPEVGDEVVLSGTISEYYYMTELSSASALEIVRSGVDIEAEVPPVEANPPVDLAHANRYWERLQGMRLQVPQNSIVLNGRNVFSPADAEFWVARSDSTIAQRSDPYTRRAFRDAHPLDDNYDPNNWDGNGYRILLGSLGIKATEGDSAALISPARTFDTVTNAPVGGLNYTFGKYRIEITEQPELSEGVDPAANKPPTTFDRTQEYSIVDYNLENLYDYRNNPFSGCDFAGDSGCPKVYPFLASVTPPFDYVPASQADYQARLNDIASQIIIDLHSPDILMVQEVENQDICKITNDAMECGTTNNADGQPDDLQDLALQIVSLGGPTYAAAFDPDSSDLRGIVPAFLYRTDRVQLLSPGGDPLLGGLPAINYAGAAASFNSEVSNPKTLNATSLADTTDCETAMVFPRAPDIGLFRIWRDGIGASVFSDVYVINNHFKSGPDSCVGPRTEQAKYNAAIVAFLEGEKPDANIVVGGDLNVYPRPDDPFAPIDQPGSSDQLGSLYDSALGLTNLWEVLLSQAPEAAYSYVYMGMAQTLDQIFANQIMMANLEQVRSAHINSDFPADYPDDGPRGTSDHDPQVGVFSVLPTLNHLEVLVYYYDSSGAITGNNTTKILIDRLERAAGFQARGKQDAYEDQLWAFISQIYDFTPQFIDTYASEALVHETELLLAQP